MNFYSFLTLLWLFNEVLLCFISAVNSCALHESEYDLISNLFSSPSDEPLYNTFFENHYSTIFPVYVPPTFMPANIPEQSARIILNLFQSNHRLHQEFKGWKANNLNSRLFPTQEVEDLHSVMNAIRFWDSHLLKSTIYNVGNFSIVRSAYRGFTLLHYTAFHGDKYGALLVIEAAKSIGQFRELLALQDSYGYLAGEIACQRGYDELAHILSCPCIRQTQTYIWEPSIQFRNFDGRWPSYVDKTIISASKCTIKQIHGKFTRNDVYQYSRSGVPVIIRDGSKHMKKLRRLFSKDNIAAYGDTVISVGSIPYGEIFGQDSSTMTAGEFMKKIADAIEHGDDLDTRIGFEKFKGRAFGINNLVKKLKIPLFRKKFQFSVGGPRSGAPAHFHQAAVNILVYGVKRWFFWPAAGPIWSYEPSYDFVQNDLHTTEYEECVQHANDVILVPAGWSHATLNAAFSISISTEYPDENDKDAQKRSRNLAMFKHLISLIHSARHFFFHIF